MTPNEYQEACKRTCLEHYVRLDQIHCVNNQHLLHAKLGIDSESGELADALKKFFIYNQEIDIENVIEECGDLLWYIALMLTACGSSMEDCMKENIEKLKIRYPEWFTEELAKERLDKK